MRIEDIVLLLKNEGASYGVDATSQMWAFFQESRSSN